MAATRDYAFPDDRRYTESDEWVRADGDAVRIGLTDYAQCELSDIVFVELPEVGARTEAGDPFGVVESVKAVSDLYAPLSGEILEINEALADAPELVNEDPYGRGWLVAIRPDDAEVLGSMLSHDDYRLRVEERSAS